MEEKKIDYGKATIVVFMITACLCGLIGFYAGIQYTTNDINTQYQEFFNTHYCIEGVGTELPIGLNLMSMNITGDLYTK